MVFIQEFKIKLKKTRNERKQVMYTNTKEILEEILQDYENKSYSDQFE